VAARRLVAVYDIESAGRDDLEFYLALAAELGSHDVADVGCGTGVLAVELAERGHRSPGSTRPPPCLVSPDNDTMLRLSVGFRARPERSSPAPRISQ